MSELIFKTLRENIADIIRTKILNQDYPPGHKIIEQELADSLGVSRGPIREALRQLQEDGLVEYRRNAGCTVRTISIEDLYETYFLRASYECLAIKISDGIFNKKELNNMINLAEQMLKLKDLELEEYYKIFEYDNAFHSIIIAKSGFPKLIKAWEQLNSGNQINIYTSDEDKPKIISKQYDYHIKLINIFQKNDVREMCKAISEHYMTTINRLDDCDYIKKHKFPDEIL